MPRSSAVHRLETSLPARFEEEAARYPSRPAVADADATLTYGALNLAANRLAHLILETITQPQQRVALLLNDDAAMVTAWLGVLKSGHSCVPLSLASPEARLSIILEDAEPSLVITNDRHLDLAHRLTAKRMPCLSIDTHTPQSPAGNPGLCVSPDAEAFLLYTSGTTGTPKGVIQVHRNILRNVHGLGKGMELDANDRVAVLSSFSTGQGVGMMFTTLLHGALLCPFETAKLGLDPLAAWLRSKKVTVYSSAVTVFRHLALSLEPGAHFPSLRLVRVGSETLLPTDVALFRKHFPPLCTLLNALSSTETGNYTQYRLGHDTPITGPSVPVGYPVEGMEVLLWDETGHDVGFERPGEIIVKSPYLSPGYWRDPKQTLKVFLEAPDGGRIYRTGDTALRRTDGCLEYLGRNDGQIKIRGFRIEPAEIEAALLQHDDVGAALVQARSEADSGEKRLVAYIIPRATRSPATGELCALLAGHLPAYMIPSAFVMLDRFPMNPNGKVDLNALPAPDATPTPGGSFVPPSSATEKALAAMWSELLSVEHVGNQDNFLDLGGQSILATKLISRIRERLQKNIPIRSIFDAPTLAALSVEVDQAPS